MIEKIPDQIPVQTGEWGGTTFDIIPKETFGMACRKINELVDAVNVLQAQVAILQEHAHPTATTEPVVKENVSYGIGRRIDISYINHIDPYAEQRKWIGCLCRCWDSDINDDIWGILQDIKDNKTEKYYLYGIGYEHCEPVKPDEDIIYKGGDNE